MAVRIDIKQLKSVARELKSKEGIGSNKGDKGTEYIGSEHWTMEMSGILFLLFSPENK